MVKSKVNLEDLMVVLLIHGGAGSVPEIERRQLANKEIMKVIGQTYPLLESGGSALDVVQKAVELMENSSVFNAGVGSVLTEEGTIQMDALLMDGSTLDVGGVIGVSKVKNPILLCRKIMESKKHVFYFGEGAEKFAVKNGIELIDPEILIVDRIRQRLIKYLEEKEQDKADPEGRDKFGTVGAVALDINGNLAAATSTGGTLGKELGRVGDTPMIGAGTYADDTIACSATGVGEFIIKSMLSLRIKHLYEMGKPVKEATKEALDFGTNIAGPSGIIVLNRKGEWTASKTTRDLIYAVKTKDLTKSFIDD